MSMSMSLGSNRDTFATGFAVASGAVALSALMYRLQSGMTGGWPYTAPENNDDEEEEEKEDTVADVPAAAQAGNDYSVDDTPTEVGGDTPPDDWDGALDDDANDMDLAASAQASNVDWLATGPMPTNSRDEEDFNLEFMRSTSNMSGLSGLSGLDRGGSEQSLSNLIPSPRGWDNGAPVPIPGADAIEAHTNVGGNKRARTSSSPRLQPMETRDALPPDGSAPGSGEHMVHMVQHNQIPAGVIEKALPAELAFALLDSKNFEPGVRPAIFNAQGTPQFLFKEKTVGGKPTKPGGPDATKADRWHNSGGIKGSRDMPPNLPLVRRRYGAVVGADGSKGFRYHEYTRVRIVEAPAADGSGRLERTVTEDRSEVLFHVMPKRTEKGRPSKSESEAPAKLWASLGVGLQQQGASVVPTIGNPQQPTVIRQASSSSASAGGSPSSMPPVPASISPAGTATPPAGLSSGMPINNPGGETENPCPHLQVNPSVASVAQGRPILALCAPPVERVQAQYISFQKGAAVLGSISQTSDGRGVSLQSVGADVAEWHRVDPAVVTANERCDGGGGGGTERRGRGWPALFEEGEIVGVHAAGLSRVTDGASVVGVVSHQAIVKGGLPAAAAAGADHEAGELGKCAGYESVAYVGRLPMRVRGAVGVGDALRPSGLNDGVAVAVRDGPADADAATGAEQICAIVLGVQGGGEAARSNPKRSARGGSEEEKEGAVVSWVDACIVPPAVGSSMALVAKAMRREAATRERERDAAMAALEGRLARLEAAGGR